MSSGIFKLQIMIIHKKKRYHVPTGAAAARTTILLRTGMVATFLAPPRADCLVPPKCFIPAMIIVYLEIIIYNSMLDITYADVSSTAMHMRHVSFSKPHTDTDSRLQPMRATLPTTYL
jgi:hypothetical protein